MARALEDGTTANGLQTAARTIWVTIQRKDTRSRFI